MMSCGSCSLVDRHFAGTIAPHDERALRSHLPDCAICRERYERYLVLAQFDHRIPSAEERLARGLGLARWRPPRARSVTLAFGLAAAAAIAVIALRAPVPGPEMRARGGPIATSDPELYVYRIGGGAGGGPARPVLDGVIHSGDELAFGYRNRGGWKRLLVYAVDPAGRVYWYHPGWLDEGTSPVAVPIEAVDERRELPEAVAQPLPAGPVSLHAVFLDEGLDVRAVERGERPERFKELVVPLTVVQD
jgi:hypothetical protein